MNNQQQTNTKTDQPEQSSDTGKLSGLAIMVRYAPGQFEEVLRFADSNPEAKIEILKAIYANQDRKPGHQDRNPNHRDLNQQWQHHKPDHRDLRQQRQHHSLNDANGVYGESAQATAATASDLFNGGSNGDSTKNTQGHPKSKTQQHTTTHHNTPQHKT